LANPNDFWSWIMTDQAKTALAGAAGGIVRWVIGAHVEGHNRGTIGICLLGGYGASADDPFEKNFTGAQALVVKRLIAEFKGRTAIRKVLGTTTMPQRRVRGPVRPTCSSSRTMHR
jgi:hypothetical protein